MTTDNFSERTSAPAYLINFIIWMWLHWADISAERFSVQALQKKLFEIFDGNELAEDIPSTRTLHRMLAPQRELLRVRRSMGLGANVADPGNDVWNGELDLLVFLKTLFGFKSWELGQFHRLAPTPVISSVFSGRQRHPDDKNSQEIRDWTSFDSDLDDESAPVEDFMDTFIFFSQDEAAVAIEWKNVLMTKVDESHSRYIKFPGLQMDSKVLPLLYAVIKEVALRRIVGRENPELWGQVVETDGTDVLEALSICMGRGESNYSLRRLGPPWVLWSDMDLVMSWVGVKTGVLSPRTLRRQVDELFASNRTNHYRIAKRIVDELLPNRSVISAMNGVMNGHTLWHAEAAELAQLYLDFHRNHAGNLGESTVGIPLLNHAPENVVQVCDSERFKNAVAWVGLTEDMLKGLNWIESDSREPIVLSSGTLSDDIATYLRQVGGAVYCSGCGNLYVNAHGLLRTISGNAYRDTPAHHSAIWQMLSRSELWAALKQGLLAGASAQSLESESQERRITDLNAIEYSFNSSRDRIRANHLIDSAVLCSWMDGALVEIKNSFESSDI